MLGTGVACSPWYSLSRDPAHPPAAPHPHTHSGDVASAADTPGCVAGCTQTQTHLATHAFTCTRANPACTHTRTPCTHRHIHKDKPMPLACTRAFTSTRGHAPCTQVHTTLARAHSHILHAHARTHMHLHTDTQQTYPSCVHANASCTCTADTSTCTHMRCPDSQLTQTYTRACTCGVGSVERGQLSLCRGEAPPVHRAAPLQPN